MPASEPSLLDVLVDRLAGAGVPAHQVWLPPPDRPAALTELTGPLVTGPALGLTTANPQLRGALQVPVALVDRPFDQRRDLLWLNLSGSAGHVAVIGGPRSGGSTLLLTILCGLSLTHTPPRCSSDASTSAVAHWPGYAGCRTSAGWPAGWRPTPFAARSGTRRRGNRPGSARALGRGWLVTRRQEMRLVQLGYLPPD